RRTREAVHAGLGRGVVGLAVLALVSVDRRDLDDAAPLARAHALDHRAGHVVDRVEVGVDDLGPLLRGHLVERGVAGDAGVVDQDIDRTELVLDPAYQRLGAFRRAHVALHQGHLEAVGLHLPPPGVGLFLVAVVGGHLVPQAGQSLADRGPDAAGSPRYQRDACRHCTLPAWTWM